MTGKPSLLGAGLYLQVMTIGNTLRQRLRRLRQPKYLFGAIAGVAYFYFMVFRRVLSPGNLGNAGKLPGLPPELAPQLLAIAALALLVIVALAWIVPGSRAALKFTEAEVAFLFPAPLTRRMLIHFKLLRSQFAIFFSAFLMSLIFRRGGLAGGNPVLHAAGWWLILSTLNLHFIGASFARERLLDLGINPARRRALVAGLLLVLAAGAWWWLRARLPVPTQDDLAGPHALFNYIGSVLVAPPVSWWLLPFKLVVAPLFAAGAGAFSRAAIPALLLLVAHYFWVVRSDISFEEASIDVARRRAERIVALSSGHRRLRSVPSKPRPAPFRLAPHGFASTALLWKNLIALGALYRLKSWFIACAIIISGSAWLAADPERVPFLKIFGGIAFGLGGVLFLTGPMFMQQASRQLLVHMDILKASPLSGRQIVLGELLSPMVVLTFLQWLLLLVAALSFSADSGDALLTTANIAVAAIGVAAIAPLLFGLMLCVPFAGLLVFPAWSEAASSQGGGVEVMGQRMIFFGGYVLVLAVVLLPVALLGSTAFLLGHWLAGMPVAMFLTTLVGGAVLAVELMAAVYWLGARVEGFDLSQEMPR